MNIEHIVLVTDRPDYSNIHLHNNASLKIYTISPNIDEVKLKHLLQGLTKIRWYRPLSAVLIDSKSSSKVKQLFTLVKRQLWVQPLYVLLCIDEFSTNFLTAFKANDILDFNALNVAINDYYLQSPRLIKSLDHYKNRLLYMNNLLFLKDTLSRYKHDCIQKVLLCDSLDAALSQLSSLSMHSFGYRHPMDYIYRYWKRILLLFLIMLCCILTSLTLHSYTTIRYWLKYSSSQTIPQSSMRVFPQFKHILLQLQKKRLHKLHSLETINQLNQQWRITVYQPLHKFFQKMPFKLSSSMSLTAKEYNQLWNTDGNLSKFIKLHPTIIKNRIINALLHWAKRYPTVTSLKLPIKLATLSPNASSITFTCGNQQLTYQHGPSLTLVFNAYNPHGCSIQFTDFDGQTFALHKTDPWSFIKLARHQSQQIRVSNFSVSLLSPSSNVIHQLTLLQLPSHL